MQVYLGEFVRCVEEGGGKCSHGEGCDFEVF